MSDFLDIRVSNDAFQNELIKISTGLVWKNQYTANQYENSGDIKTVDQFISAKKGIINFDSIWDIDIDILQIAGLDDKQINAAIDNKYSIPFEKRDIIVSMQIKKFLSKNLSTDRYNNYEEKNNYYRMLYGLPDIDDTDYIYITNDPNIDPNTPVHELDISKCHYLEGGGKLEELTKLYPNKKYIHYLASKRIDPYQSRCAERYEILWMEKSDNEFINETFMDVYENCRMNVLRTYFRKDLVTNNIYYEGFLAMCILFMTINLMNYKYLNADITRDFFDIESLKFIYESYGVPFYSNIPIEYHKNIVKNINVLLSYKGSTRVFYELFNLFDYANIDIYAYYLLKRHKIDSNGNPLFVYNDDGSINNKQTYDIKMGQVKLYDNPPLELSDPLNQFSYEEIVNVDPYWVSDGDLMDKLYSEKFNYRETKYLGIRTIFDMMKIVYESSYMLKLLMDNREMLNGTLVYYALTGNYHNIFSLTIYLCALICKKYGYDVNISNSLPSVSKCLGYNFKADITGLRELVLNNPYTKENSELISIIQTLNVNSIESINSAFEKIINIKKYLLGQMWKSSHPEEYSIYKHLYKTLVTSYLIEDVFKKSDGKIAEDYADLLLDIDQNLYARLNDIEESAIDTELSNIFALYHKSFSQLEWFRYMNGADIGPLLDQLMSLLRYFKSAKAELTGYTIVYTISNPEENFLKLMDCIENGEHTIKTCIKDNTLIDDLLYNTKHNIMIKDKLLVMRDKLCMNPLIIKIDSKIKFLKDLIRIEEHIILSVISYGQYIDLFFSETNTEVIASLIKLTDKLKLIYDDIQYPMIYLSLPDDIFRLSDKIFNVEIESNSLFIDETCNGDLMKISSTEMILFDKGKPYLERLTLDNENICGWLSKFNTRSLITMINDQVISIKSHLSTKDCLNNERNEKITHSNLNFKDNLVLIEEDKLEEANNE